MRILMTMCMRSVFFDFQIVVINENKMENSSIYS